MDMGEIPEPWSTVAEQAGLRQTYRGIGEAAGLSHVTVRRLITEGRTSPSTVNKVAAALRVEASKVYQWADIELSEWGPWTPPAEAHRLHPRVRAALDELIRAVTQGGTDARQAEEQKTPDGGGGVTPIRPSSAYLDQAARTGRKGRRHIDEATGAVGEENQDPDAQ